MCDKMKKYLIFTVASLLLMPSCLTKKEKPGELTRTSGEVKLVTLDPGHFHAALYKRTLISKWRTKYMCMLRKGTMCRNI